MFKGMLLTVLLVISSLVFGAPGKDYWGYWDKENSASEFIVDHAGWQLIIDKYLKYSESRKMYLFDYAHMKKADHERLLGYLDSLSKLDPREFNRNEQLAYWVNLYNALTVELILKNYPVKSITRLGKGWFRMGPWKDKMISITGKDISLHDIEHRILRPIWNDPKIHYTLNCASVGCPDLLPEVYTSEKIQHQLAAAGNHFINQQKGVNEVRGRLVISTIFDWYDDDFGGRKGIRAELLEHGREKLKEKVRAYRGRFGYHYDWQLNEYTP